MRFLVAGGAGFMGCNYVRFLLKCHGDVEVLVYDKLTYAGRLENLHDVRGDSRFKFVRGDICDEEQLMGVVRSFQPDVIVNLAAETHVDRSINEPAPFLKTNVFGVFTILEVSRRLDVPLTIQISSDEVYGDLRGGGSADELYPFKPSSPYSVSKASGDLMALAYYRTYGLPVIVVRPSNNYGPYQFPEKLIPKTIIRALHGRCIPIYGGGMQVRDWLYVDDFCEALQTIVLKGRVGEAYNVPGFNERRNIDVVTIILKLMNKPQSLIRYVEDRPGHDFRYSMRGDKILALGWSPKTSFMEGLRRTVDWYLNNEWWWRPVLSDEYFVEDTPWKVGR